MQKVVPSERLRRELDDVLAGIDQEQDPIEAVARLGARLILQQALEDEVTEFLGRARYERADGGEEVIYRNGFRERQRIDGEDEAPLALTSTVDRLAVLELLEKPPGLSDLATGEQHHPLRLLVADPAHPRRVLRRLVSEPPPVRGALAVGVLSERVHVAGGLPLVAVGEQFG